MSCIQDGNRLQIGMAASDSHCSTGVMGVVWSETPACGKADAFNQAESVLCLRDQPRSFERLSLPLMCPRLFFCPPARSMLACQLN